MYQYGPGYGRWGPTGAYHSPLGVLVLSGVLEGCQRTRNTKYPCSSRRCVLCQSLDIYTIPSYILDPPRGKEEWIPIDPKFQHGIDLVSYIRSKPEFSSQFCVGVAGSFADLSFSVQTFKVLLQLILKATLTNSPMKKQN